MRSKWKIRKQMKEKERPSNILYIRVHKKENKMVKLRRKIKSWLKLLII